MTTVALLRAYSEQVVEPAIRARFPGLPYAVGRLGQGSDVLGVDDAMSQDHDWGLRLSLFVPAGTVSEVLAEIERALPESFRGLPTRFAGTGEAVPRHHVDVDTVAGFLDARLGFDPRGTPSATDWLSLTGQAALEVVAGPVFTDHPGELRAARRALTWYPDDLWRYVLACDWIRLGQELPSMGRAADVGDSTGARLIAARVVRTAMHLAFLLERRWPPYPKWFGTLFRALPGAADLAPSLDRALGPADRRQHDLSAVLTALLDRQNALGLTAVTRATVPFFDRPYVHPDPAIAAQLLAGIEDAEVRAFPPGRGGVEQRTDDPGVLMDARTRRAAVDR